MNAGLKSDQRRDERTVDNSRPVSSSDVLVIPNYNLSSQNVTSARLAYFEIRSVNLPEIFHTEDEVAVNSR